MKNITKGFLYLAAPWTDRFLMSDRAKLFEDAGFEITHKWWDNGETEESPDDILLNCAKKDVRGVCNADIVVVYDTGKSEGKAVEQGIALGRAIPIACVGRRGEHSNNIFHRLPAPHYQWFTTPDEVLSWLETLADAGRKKLG